jgi:hypothetical protein
MNLFKLIETCTSKSPSVIITTLQKVNLLKQTAQICAAWLRVFTVTRNHATYLNKAKSTFYFRLRVLKTGKNRTPYHLQKKFLIFFRVKFTSVMLLEDEWL